MTTTSQCKSCPWRIDCVPEKDIPIGYSCELHERLRGTIRSGPESFPGSSMRIMACHYSRPGEEFPCAGWLANQLGAGNNIAVRLAVAVGRLPVPELDGPQHDSFDDTLPYNAPRARARRRATVRGTRYRPLRIYTSDSPWVGEVSWWRAVYETIGQYP